MPPRPGRRRWRRLGDFSPALPVMAGLAPAMTGPQRPALRRPAKNKALIANPVDGRSDNGRTQRRCTQMDADAREWTERNGPSVARLQAASSRCRRAGWDRDRRGGRRHLRPSACICVHLRSTFLTSLRDRSTPGGTFGPPPRNQTPPAFDRLRDEKGLFRRLGGFRGSTGTGLVSPVFPRETGIISCDPIVRSVDTDRVRRLP